MTDVGTLPGGRVMSWLNGTSTEWRAADRDAPHHGRITTAAMLAISSPGTGATCELTDCGNIVSTWYYNGTYWVPFGGEQKIYSLMADTYNATADGTERVNGNAQCTIPANLLSTDGMGFKLRFAAYKSAAAESPVVAIKFGANGTIAAGTLSSS